MRHVNQAVLESPTTENYLLIWMGVLFGAGFFIADSLIDALVFENGTLLDQLLHPSWHEIWMRSFVLFLSLSFGIYAHFLLRRERKAAVKVKNTEKFLSTIIDNIPGMVFIKDARELRFVLVNHAGEKLLGYESEQLIGKNDYDFFPREQADFFTTKDREALASGGEDIPEEEIATRCLGRRLLHTKKVSIRDQTGQPAYLLGVAEDITEARQAEIALQKTETRLRTLFDAAPECIFLIDLDGVIQRANRFASEHTGFSHEELIGRNIKEFFTVASQRTCDCNFPGLRERGYNEANIDFVHKDGHVIPMECLATGVHDEGGNFSSFLIIQRDITERIEAAAALSESERKFRAIFNSTFQFIGLLDPDGILLEANQTALDFCGHAAEDVIGKPFWETPWWSMSSRVKDQLREAIREAASGKLVRYEVEHLDRNCRVAVIDFSLKPVLNDQGQTVLIIPEGRDITDRKQAEEAIRIHQQESAHLMRLSAMGEMASGMAHELNQPLTALISYCESASVLLTRQPAGENGLLELIERATEQAHRASEIIRHLRQQVSKGGSHQEPVVSDRLIRDVVKFLEWELDKSGVEVELDLNAGHCTVRVDKVEIEQVMINLIKNSIDAISGSNIERGRLVIGTNLLPDDVLEVTVTDNGPGIDESEAGVVFDRFMTSKQSGMGMGLPISRSIIESHGGKLWLDEGYHGGARFGFRLPGCERGTDGGSDAE